MRGRRARGERGETLAEVLIAIAIISVAVVVIVGGVATSILASNVHRTHTSADVVARDVAEALKDNTSPTWVASGAYPSSIWSSVVPSGFSVSVTAQCWSNVNSFNPPTFSSCTSAPGNANLGLQQLTITVSGSQGVTESVTILKRRNCANGALTC